MFDKLSEEEKIKIEDFMSIFRAYVNKDSDEEIDKIVDCAFDSMIKIYNKYKTVVPYVSVDDDSYDYYIIRPVDHKYCLLDYLINTLIQNLDSIVLIDNSKSNYNMLRKKISINTNLKDSIPDSIFSYTTVPIDKEKFINLYYKNSIYHEISHMFHYKIRDYKPNTVYVPSTYINRTTHKFNKRKHEEKNRIQARDRLKARIGLYYDKLKDKYNILNPNDIDNCNVEVEKYKFKFEDIIVPPFNYLNPTDEGFAEVEAQQFSGLFENELFENGREGYMSCFYIPIGDDKMLMTYSPSGYAISNAFCFAIKDCASKKSYFRTVFLSKDDLFVEMFGEYNIQVVDLSYQLMLADKGDSAAVDLLIKSIIDFSESKNVPLEALDPFLPLVNKDSNWAYASVAYKKPDVNQKVYKSNI